MELLLSTTCLAFKGNKEFYYPRAFFVLKMTEMEKASPSIPNKEKGLGVKPPA
jgi:hypothetical protein